MARTNSTSAWKKDHGLQFRMFLTAFLLFAVYIFFFAAITLFFDVGLQSMIAIFGIFSIAQWYFSDTLALRAMRARIVGPVEYPDLHRAVSYLSVQAGLPKTPKIAVMPTSIPNAFATGRSQQNAAVCVSNGLLNLLTQDELEGVIAHELAHIKNRDVTIMTMASFLSTIAFFIVRWGWIFQRNSRNSSKSPIYVAVIVSLLVWLISFFLIKSLSRYREFAADKGAATITRKPLELASALRKISSGVSNIPPSQLKSQSEMNAFFIIPFKLDLIGKLFSTHPPVEERISRLEKFHHSPY
jgi:heat shock protein HtpX